ncbi:hypothetical protein J6590_050969 [Homalodisca vitripennis]|nr:hypothetical protein J6590_050969 [Homalodisca vitripennis]
MEDSKEQTQGPVKDEDTTPELRRVHLYTSVLILNIIYLAVGTAFAWSSPMLMKLDLTPDDSSTVASVMYNMYLYSCIAVSSEHHIPGCRNCVRLVVTDVDETGPDARR